ncbi:MAG: hypothetical protein HPY76_04810, partial [Anaerolineae bacterium]|nr:hypothetical protein [Anaerolineae bacterium]
LAIPDEQVNVFQLVDAMTAAEGSAALASLHKLLDDEEPLMIFGMVTRQFRLLLLARAVIDAGGGRDQILKQIGDVRSDFVAGKIYNQVRHWSAPTLEAIYRRLFEIDRDVKTGQVAVEVALDQLVVEVCTGVRG